MYLLSTKHSYLQIKAKKELHHITSSDGNEKKLSSFQSKHGLDIISCTSDEASCTMLLGITVKLPVHMIGCQENKQAFKD